MSDNHLPRSFRLTGADELQPFQQGNLDGLCGIYSLINAIHLVSVKKLTKRELDELFSFAIHQLAEKGDLCEFICRGVPWKILKDVGFKLVHICTSGSHKLELEVIRRGDPARVDQMRNKIRSGSALIASLYRDEHYSVVVGWTPTRAILFDSSAGHWVPLRTLKCALCVSIRPKRRRRQHQN